MLICFQVNIFHAQTTITANITYKGQNRNYRLRLPANHDKNTAIPLVFNLHGFTSNAIEQEIYSGMNIIADTARFAVCYPNGISNAWNVGWSFGSTADDVGFISTLIDQLNSTYGIDKSRVYACGMSNGGFMSYRLACELNDRIAAIASVTGSMVQQAINSCKPGKSVPVMEIHGTADPVVNYNGTVNVSVAISKVLKFWQENNGCDINPTIEQVPNKSITDNTTAEKWTYTNCENNKKLIHYKITNGGHTWPGSIINNGTTSQDFNASEEIWKFFKQYSLDITSSTNDEMVEEKIYPNPCQDFFSVYGHSNSDFTIMNINCQKIYSGQMNENSMEVSTLGWSSGTYFIKIQTGLTSSIHKLIKI